MKIFKSTFVLGISLILLAAPGRVLAKKKIELKYNLQKNAQYVTKSNINQDIQMQNQGQTVDIQGVTTRDVTTVVSNVSGNAIQFTNKINRITLTRTVYGKKIHYDSSDPSTYASGAGQMIGDRLNKLVGKSYEVIIDHLGNIKSYDMSNLGEDSRTAGSLSSGGNYIVFPDHSIEVGDTWEADIKPIKNSDMDFHVKYILKKISGNEATIGISTKISGSKVSDNAMTMDGVQNGEATVDIRTGWTTSINVNQEVKMSVQENGTSIPMTVSGTIVETSKKK